MKPIQRPYWIFLTITSPQLLLFLIFGKIYSVIGTLLDHEAIWAWKLAGSTLGLMGLGLTGYALWCVWQKKPLHPSSGFAILGGYLLWLYPSGPDNPLGCPPLDAFLGGSGNLPAHLYPAGALIRAWPPGSGFYAQN